MADYILSAKITGDSSNFSKAFEEAEGKIKGFKDSTKDFGSKLNDVGDKMQSVGGKVSLMSAPIALFGKQVFDTGKEFEASMSKVQAISGATGSDLEALESKAREMGSTTRYSASEAADAMSFMALAGYDTTQMISALPSVLDLATAGELDLARASEIVTGNLNAFGLEAEDAARVADVLSFAQANSGTSAEELASALEVVAPAAAAAGNDIETTSAIIGILADQNIKGSKAGTYLNSMFNDLQKSAVDGAVAIGETSVAVYDAEGNFRDMGDILVDVEAATEGMTEEQKNNALMAVFQQQSMKGVNSILNAGTDELVGLKEGLNDSTGAAGEMSAIMDDNLAGSVAGMGSSFDELKLRLFDVAEQGFKKVVDKVTEIIDWFASLDDSTLGTIATIAGIIVAVGPVLIILGSLIKLVGLVSTGISFLTSPIGLAIAAFALLVAGGVLLYKNWDKIKEKVAEMGRNVKQKVEDMKTAVSEKFEAVKTAVSGKVESMKKAVVDKYEQIKTGIDTKIDNMKTSASNKFEAIKTAIGSKVDSTKSAVSTKFEAIKKVMGDKIDSAKTAVTTKFEAVKTAIDGKVEAVRSAVSTKFEAVKTAMTGPIEAAKETISRAIEAVKGFFSGLRLKFPKIEMPKLPRFSLTGKFSLLPPSVPKLNIDWNAAGGIFTKPTILGNQGFGEAGHEAILPISKLSGMIANTMEKMGYDKRIDNSRSIGYGDINVTIPAKDIKEFKDVTDFFSKIGQVAKAGVVSG